MKNQLKKIFSAALCVCLSLSLFSFGGFADCGPADPSFITQSTTPLTGDAVEFAVSAVAEFMPRPNMGYSGVVVWLFQSYEELHAFTKEYDSALSDVTLQYPAAFFGGNALMVVTVSLETLPYAVEVDSVVKSGVGVGVNMTVRQPQTQAAMGTCVTTVLELKKADVAQVNNVSYYLERKTEWSGNDDQAPLRAGSAYSASAFAQAPMAYVTGVALKTTKEAYLSNFTYDDMTVYGSDQKEITDGSAHIGTGFGLVAKKEGIAVAVLRAVVRGDVDGDAKITAADARLALRASAKLIRLDEENQQAAKVLGKDGLTAGDARLILRVSAGIDRFPSDKA
ncbi:MAG: hypothetical protein LBS36_12375 [Oscillospiraceae bacterium]|nr:hypothetical protein [Oscillospiraceae bacterium]